MIPTDTVFNRMMELLGADTLTVGTVATPTAAIVILVKANFSPGPGLRLADLVEADFPGYAQKTCASAPQNQSNDGSNGDSLLTIPPLAGGFLWETSAAPSPNQSIYGYAVIGHGPEIIGAAKLNPVVVLSGAHQIVEIPYPSFRQVAGSVV